MQTTEGQAIKPHRSVEFFPPKTEKSAEAFRSAAEAVRDWKADWVSLTYGAGGKSRGQTFEWSTWLKDEMRMPVLQHLTCIGHTEAELSSMLGRLEEDGYAGVMALRGDIPRDETEAFKEKGALKYASELVAYIRSNHDSIRVGVAGYPEKHPEAPSLDADIDHLKRKVDAGADFVVTQLFFENADFYRFIDKCRKAGIDVPIIPGLLPPVELEKLKKFCAMCEANIPARLESELLAAEEKGGAEARIERGIAWMLDQVQELMAQGAPGYHLYLLNRKDVFQKLVPGLP